MSTKTNKSANELKELSALLRRLDQILERTQQVVKQERQSRPTSEATLKAEINNLITTKAQLNNKINRLKNVCAKRKEEIKDWQEHFSNVPDLEKPMAKQQLNIEVSRRLKEISDKEAEIGRLYLEHNPLVGEIEFKKIQLEAFYAGAHLLPIEEDPRIKEILMKKERVLSQINKLN
jgi:seryl-tRNA synthetase